MPPEPMTCAPRQSRTRQHVAQRRRARRAAAAAAPSASAPSPRYRSVSRSAPNGQRDRDRRAGRRRASASSSEPPPMSITTVAAGAEVEVRERAAEGEPRLVLAARARGRASPVSWRTRAEELRRRSRRRAPRSSRPPRCASRRAGARASPCVRAPRRARCIDCVAELPGAVEAGAEAGRRLHLVDDADRAVGGDVGDDLPDRVGADVDRGDAARSDSASRRESGAGGAAGVVTDGAREGCGPQSYPGRSSLSATLSPSRTSRLAPHPPNRRA